MMAKNGNIISTPKIYELLNDLRKEMTQSLSRVESKIEEIGKSFNDFEKGRLTKIETETITLREQVNVHRIIIFGQIGLIIIAVFTAIIRTVVK